MNVIDRFLDWIGMGPGEPEPPEEPYTIEDLYRDSPTETPFHKMIPEVTPDTQRKRALDQMREGGISMRQYHALSDIINRLELGLITEDEARDLERKLFPLRGVE